MEGSMAQTEPAYPARDFWCTLVVPCYNEAARLQPDRFLSFLTAETTKVIARDIRFLFVNDGSRDDTLAVLRTLEASAPGLIRVLDRQPNAGKGEAVRAGMLQAIAGSAFVGFWDADLATPLHAIPFLRDILERDPSLEMVFGSRVALLGHRITRNPLRHYVGRVFATVVSATLRVPIYDSQCGAKLFRVTPSLSQVLAQPFQSRWIFDVEILARFLALHRSETGYCDRAIFETPLDEWTEIPGSKVSPADFIKSLWEVFRIRARYLQ
jgi:dolichyl-phosphate beta-glucosyltransferase